MKVANRIASWLLALSIMALVASEEHARRIWKDRAVEAQANLIQVRQFLALERTHVKKLCSLLDLADAMPKPSKNSDQIDQIAKAYIKVIDAVNNVPERSAP